MVAGRDAPDLSGEPTWFVVLYFGSLLAVVTATSVAWIVIFVLAIVRSL